jgi:Dolichyl-phosphate-mannose-protein mannosyltransferase
MNLVSVIAACRQSAKRFGYLLVPLVIGLFLRIPGLSTGLPYFYDEDEAHHFNRTVDMVKRGDFNPHYFLKPSFHFYLRMPIVAVAFLREVTHGRARQLDDIVTHDRHGIAGYSFSTSHPAIVKALRAVSLISGLLAIALTYYLTLALLKLALLSNREDKPSRAVRQVAGFTALMAALSPPLIQGSTMVLTDVIVVTLVMLSAYFAVTAHGRILWLMGSAAAAGLSISTKYNALPVVIAPLSGLLIHRPNRLLRGVLLVTIIGITFILATPFLFVELPLFLNHVAYELWHYGIEGHEGNSGKPGLSQAQFYLTWLSRTGLGWLFFIGLCIPGMALCWNKHLWKQAFAVSGTLLLYGGFMCTQKANFTRNMHLAIPLAASCGGLGLWYVAGYLSNRGISSLQKKTILALCIMASIGSIVPGTYALMVQQYTLQENRVLVLPLLKAQPLPSLALDASLEWEPAVKRNKEFSIATFNDLFDAYISGFNEVITTPIKSTMPLLKPEQFLSLPGAPSPQRIVANPALVGVRFGLTDLLLPHIVKALPQRITTLENRTPCEETKEKVCWITHRITRLVLPFKSAQGFTYEASSPWGNSEHPQIISWYDSEGKPILTPLPVSQGWVTHRVALDFSVNQSSQPLYLTISIIHAPSEKSDSKDTRRLGIAMRNIRPMP